MKIILQKFIAQSGYCSRRKAEQLINERLVKVNGRNAEPGMLAGPEDKVEISGRPIGSTPGKITLLLNKPAGYTCTNRIFKGESNIFELLQGSEYENTRLTVAGRLDKNSRGLVLLTNDGDLAYRLTHPKFEHKKEYEAIIQNSKFKIQNLITAKKEPPLPKSEVDKIVKTLCFGIDIGEGDGVVKAKKAEYIKDNVFRIILTEGKKRQIRRMFKNLGYEVADLQRVRIGEYNLGKLKEGEWKKYEA